MTSLEEILKAFSIDPLDWDILIIGDGSGSDWKRGCGWAAVLIDHYYNYRFPFYGGWSSGTSHIAEILPYLHAMTWYAAGPGKTRAEDLVKDGCTTNTVKIHIISDNSTVVNQGNRKADRSNYGWLWDSFVGLERLGYVFTWHWCERSKLALNKLTDQLSRHCRITIEEVSKKIEEETSQKIDDLIYDFNPQDDTSNQSKQ